MLNTAKNDKVKREDVLIGKGLITMDYNQYNNGQNYRNQNYFEQQTPRKKGSGFAIASMVCGICSAVLFCMGLSLPFAALGILFAVLTRRKGKTMDSISIAGIATSCIGLFLSIIMIINVFVQLPRMMEDPALRKELDTVYEGIYGENFADFWENNYGIKIE